MGMLLFEHFILVFSFFFFYCLILLSISFFTLIERKILRRFQQRKGPNKLGFFGEMQPFSDALKLYGKESFFIFSFLKMIFHISSFSLLLLICLLWFILPVFNIILNIKRGFLYLLIIFRLSVIPILIISWYSNCKYSIIGGLRNVTQIVSYEVCISFIMISFICYINSFNIYNFCKVKNIIFISLILILYVWLPVIFSESNRTPFDFSEGESELVSGFNTEYRGSYFAFFFIAEYMSIIYLSLFSCYLFLYSDIKLGFISIIFCILYIFCRGFLPRFRYDILIIFCWKSLLPYSICIIFLILIIII